MTKSLKCVSGLVMLFGGVVSSQVLITKFFNFSEYVQKFRGSILNKPQHIPEVTKDVCGDSLWSKLFKKGKIENPMEFLFESRKDRIDYQNSWYECIKDQKVKVH